MRLGLNGNTLTIFNRKLNLQGIVDSNNIFNASNLVLFDNNNVVFTTILISFIIIIIIILLFY